jgi:hypothetical protein
MEVHNHYSSKMKWDNHCQQLHLIVCRTTVDGSHESIQVPLPLFPSVLQHLPKRRAILALLHQVGQS